MNDITREPKPTQDELAFWSAASSTSPAARIVVPQERSPRPGREYDADYYLHGKETGKSLYTDYRWLPELTLPMCRRIVEYCGIGLHETVNDFGCARGYIVRALRHLGYEAYGQDVSEWAITNADPAAARFLVRSATPQDAHWTLAKDVLEHLDDDTLHHTLTSIAHVTRRGVFIVVPLAGREGRYVVPEYEQDVTHKQRLSLFEWLDLAARCMGNAWEIGGCLRVPGIKDNWAHYADGNGFLLARRTTKA